MFGHHVPSRGNSTASAALPSRWGHHEGPQSPRSEGGNESSNPASAASTLAQSMEELRGVMMRCDVSNSGCLARPDFVDALLQAGGHYPQVQKLADRFRIGGEASDVDYVAFLHHIKGLMTSPVGRWRPAEGASPHSVSQERSNGRSEGREWSATVRYDEESASERASPSTGYADAVSLRSPVSQVFVDNVVSNLLVQTSGGDPRRGTQPAAPRPTLADLSLPSPPPVYRAVENNAGARSSPSVNSAVEHASGTRSSPTVHVDERQSPPSLKQQPPGVLTPSPKPRSPLHIAAETFQVCQPVAPPLLGRVPLDASRDSTATPHERRAPAPLLDIFNAVASDGQDKVTAKSLADACRARCLAADDGFVDQLEAVFESAVGGLSRTPRRATGVNFEQFCIAVSRLPSATISALRRGNWTTTPRHHSSSSTIRSNVETPAAARAPKPSLSRSSTPRPAELTMPSFMRPTSNSALKAGRHWTTISTPVPASVPRSKPVAVDPARSAAPRVVRRGSSSTPRPVVTPVPVEVVSLSRRSSNRERSTLTGGRPLVMDVPPRPPMAAGLGSTSATNASDDDRFSMRDSEDNRHAAAVAPSADMKRPIQPPAQDDAFSGGGEYLEGVGQTPGGNRRHQNFLSLCSRMDNGATGELPRRQVQTALRTAVPELSAHDVSRLLNQAAAHNPSSAFVAMTNYFDVLSALLLRGGGDQISPSPRRRHDAVSDTSLSPLTPVAGRRQLPRGNMEFPTAFSRGAEAQPSAPAPLATARNTTSTYASMCALLAAELLSAAHRRSPRAFLCAKLSKFDGHQSGYVPTVALSRAVRDFFSPHAAPTWVIDRCESMAQLPFERGSPTILPDNATALRAARMRAQRWHSAQRNPNSASSYCDYFYLLDELDRTP